MKFGIIDFMMASLQTVWNRQQACHSLEKDAAGKGGVGARA